MRRKPRWRWCAAGTRRLRRAGRKARRRPKSKCSANNSWPAQSSRCSSAGAYTTDYDAHVGRKLANILAGGPLTSPQLVSEQYVLDLEREAFVSLCGEKKTQERIAFTLKTGKPLRN
jgi:hypothetical protein